MNCANHSDQAAVAFCRTCGKPLCQTCTRDVRGVIYCESCLAAKIEGANVSAAGFVPPSQGGYQTVIPPGMPGAPGMRVPSGGSGPQPVVAGILAGFFPIGVGAVYCSQYAKGLAYLVIMVLLGYGTDHAGGLGGIFVAAFLFFWVFQIIDAIRTAKAMQTGEPIPDPLGIAQAFGGGGTGAEKIDVSKVPIGAVILIGLGVLFLLHTLGVWEFGFSRFWPLIIVAFGAFMFYRQWERPDRCQCGRCRMRGIMGPAMVLTTGILFLLQSTDAAPIDHTWPAWILVVGIVKLMQSTAPTEGHIGPLPPGPGINVPPVSGVDVPPPTAPAPTENSSGEVNHV